MTKGMPMRLRSLLHSSLCSRVTLTVRREKRSMSSAVPEGAEVHGSERN